MGVIDQLITGAHRTCLSFYVALLQGFLAKKSAPPGIFHGFAKSVAHSGHDLLRCCVRPWLSWDPPAYISGLS